MKATLYSIDSDTVSRAAFADNGIDVLTTETFQTGATDFSAQLTRIKEHQILRPSLSLLYRPTYPRS